VLKDSVEQESTKLHLSYLDGVRACAALYIVFHHAVNTIIWQIPKDRLASVGIAWNAFFWIFGDFGQEAVAVFITLSGFCLMLPVVKQKSDFVLKGGAARFYKKRAMRILPAYYLAIVVCLILIATLIGQKTGTPWDLSLSGIPGQIATPFSLITHFFLLHDLFEKTHGQIEGPLWSVAAEWRIYFLFPAIVWAWKKYGVEKTVLVLVLLGIVANPICRKVFERFNIPIAVYPTAFVPEYLSLFVLGAFGAAIAFSTQESMARLKKIISWRISISIILCLLITSKLPLSFPGKLERILHNSTFQNLLVGIITSAVLVAIYDGKINFFRKLMEWKPIVYVGGISYSMYLLHYPILQLVYQYLISKLNLPFHYASITMLIVSFPVVLLFTIGFYLLIERPSHRLATSLK
jgi:peptidoglycan/LPS O-acetylase OafA/YrhL